MEDSMSENEKINVLVAEDSAVNRKILVHLLTKMGFEVSEHENGQLAWDDFKVNEMLVGVDFDSCCWNLRLAMMDISVDEVINQQSLFPVNTDRQYFFEFTLKGIGTGFGTIEDILQRLDFGYSGRLFNYR